MTLQPAVEDSSLQTRLRVASNLPSLGSAAPPGVQIEHVALSTRPGWAGMRENARIAASCDAVLINTNAAPTMFFCALRWLWPRARFTLVSVDILLVEPHTRRQKLAAHLKRLLLRQVDLFVLFFKDLSGYQKHFGISEERAAFIPFKVNLWDDLPPEEALSADGSYVLCCGRSHRDLPTFVAASKITGLPTVLLCQRRELMSEHGAVLIDSRELPPNVREEVHDGARESWMEWLRNARVVVIPIRSGVISSPGVSTIMDAMALKKCVVITEGPATHGIIDGQALTVPAADPPALAAMISRVWNDDPLRHAVATRARRFALAMQGEQRLRRDVIGVLARTVRGRQRAGEA